MPIDEVIHIDESFETRVLGQTVSIPVRGDIPVRMAVKVPIDTVFAVQASAPVAFLIAEELPVEIDWQIPIDLEVPVAFPVETQVTVLFKQTIPISLEVPVVLDVPIDIALGDTAFGAYLKDLAELLPWIRFDPPGSTSPDAAAGPLPLIHRTRRRLYLAGQRAQSKPPSRPRRTPSCACTPGLEKPPPTSASGAVHPSPPSSDRIVAMVNMALGYPFNVSLPHLVSRSYAGPHLAVSFVPTPAAPSR